jgi:hypothetical protein
LPARVLLERDGYKFITLGTEGLRCGKVQQIAFSNVKDKSIETPATFFDFRKRHTKMPIIPSILQNPPIGLQIEVGLHVDSFTP